MGRLLSLLLLTDSYKYVNHLLYSILSIFYAIILMHIKLSIIFGILKTEIFNKINKKYQFVTH